MACLEHSCQSQEWNEAPEYRTVWHSERCAVLLSTEACGTECCAIVRYLSLTRADRIATVKKDGLQLLP